MRPRRARPTSRRTPPLPLLLLLLACSLPHFALAATSVTTSGGTTAYTEGNAAGVTKVDALLTVSSDSLISKAEILLSYGDPALADADDRLSVSPFNGLSQGSGYDTTDQKLTVTGLGTAATYQSVLRTVSFYSSSQTPKTSARTATFKIYDSDGLLKSTATKSVSVTLVDNVPSVTLSDTNNAYTEGQGALVLDSGLVVSDPDSANLVEAELKITSGYETGKDVLDPAQDVTKILGSDGVTPAGLTSSFAAGTGTLTISGTATVATYQALLRKCTYQNDAKDASNAQRQVTIKVKDSSSYSTGSILTIAFTAVAQAPVLTGSSTTFKWVEGNAAVNVDDSVAISDEDSTHLSSAEVRFTSGYDSGKDVLGYSGGSVTASWDAAAGKLTLTGVQTLATYQTVLRSVTFNNPDESPAMGDRTVEFKVFDEPPNSNEPKTPSNAITRTFTVSSVNDPPTLDCSNKPSCSDALSYNGLTVSLQDTAVLSDPDDANLAKAFVEITGGCLSTDSFSTATAVAGILMDNGTPCVATFTGSASVADYQTMLRGVQLTLATGTSFERIVKITVNDGVDNSTSMSRYYYALDNLPIPTIVSTTAPETSGGTITITGTNFGPASPNLVTKVQLGMSECTSITVTEAYTKLTCTAPAGTGQDIAVVVTVGDKKSTPYASFKYQNPTVSSITSVPTAGGTVTITGTNFGPAGSAALSASAGGSIVVAGKACTSGTVSVAHTKITCTQLEGTGGGKDVTVTVSTLSSGTTGNGKFSYELPTISTKSLGSFLGYTTTFTGSNFGLLDTALTVTITPSAGGASFACSSAKTTKAHTEFQCTMPAASLTSGANTNDLTKLYDVKVVCDSLEATGSSKFQYEGPVITSVGTVSLHGAEVTITGRNFGPLNQVITKVNIGGGGFYVDGTVGTNANDTPSGKCVPKTTTEHTTVCAYFKDYKTTGNSMTPTVSLEVGGQTSNTFTAFSYEGPVITGTSTGSQFGGGPTSTTAITITGRNFGPARTFGDGDATYGTETLSIGGTQVNTGTKTVVSDTEITATTSPATHTNPLTTQNADISMTLFDQSSSGGTGKFSYIGPIITSVSSAPSSGGVITITGDNFGPVKATADYFNTGTYANAGVTLCADSSCSSTITCSNPQVTTAETKITCTMGSGVPVSTKVTVKMFDATLTSGSTGDGKLSVAAPAVTSMTPADGVVTTGGEITVTGTSFGPAGNSYVTVKAGTYTCSSVNVVSHTQLKCTVPAGFGGNLDLQVKLTNDGASLTSAANTVFKYAKPTVTSVTSVDTVGGTVTITGTNFGPLGSTVESVTLNSAGVNSPSITVAHTEIVGEYTTGGTGTGYPAIVTMGGQASATNTLFSYRGPTVSSVTTAPSIFGGSLVLAGTNLGPTGLSAAKITVTVTGDGNAACTSPTVNSHTSLTCTITCTTVCNDATRDVSVTIDGQTSGTTGNGLLKYEGPVITSVPAISYHSVKGNTPTVIEGRNFGDGTHINSIKMCALSSSSTCTGSAAYTYGKEFETASTVSVVTSGTKIQGFFKEHIGDDYSVVVTVNNIASTGGDGILDFTGPTITADSSNLIATTVPTAGGTLTVAGTNFGPVGDSNIMKIVWDSSSTAVTPAGSSATVSVANTEITFTAPAGAGTKTFSFTISVNGTTAGALATNAVQMKYVAPVITSITQSGTAGSTVTITGTNFGPTGATEITSLKLTDSTGNQVDFTEATVSVANTQITAKAPAGSGQNLAVTLVIGGQTATGGDTAFSYVAPAVTSVAAISTGPTWTTTGYGAYETTAGAWVTITGTNFGPSQALTSLTIGTVECSNPFVTVADTQVMCLFGPGAGKNYDVAFSVNSIAATGGTGKFGYSIPLISSATTTSYFGGDIITITGTNFGPAAGDATKKLPTGADPTLSVTVAGNACTSPTITVGHTSITCTAPQYLDQGVISGLQVAVTVQGQTGTGEYAYSGPSITSVSDVSMFGGPVTVTGTNFGPTGSDANIESIFVGGVQQNLNDISPSVTKANTEIVFTAAAGTGSSLNVKIYIRGQNTGTTGNGLMSYFGPQVTSASTISTLGGTVTITGKHFGPVGTSQINFVTIDGVFCTNAQVTVATSQITCDFQKGIGQGYNVVVKLNGETSQTTGNGKFGYNLPTISSVTPSTGGLGTQVTIEGADFGHGAAGTAGLSKTTAYFKVSGSGAKNYLTDVTVHSNTKITGTIPLGTGANQILYVEVDTVVNTDGARFSYGTPTVTSVSTVGPMGGTITVTGTNFGPTGAGQISSVKFGSAVCVNPTVVTVATKLTCDMPKAQTTANGGDFSVSDLDGDGLMDVVATIDGIASTGGTKMFKFDQPRITQISPALVAKNEDITITGTNFGDHKSSVLLKASSTYLSLSHVGSETNVTTITDTEIVMKVPTGFGKSAQLSVLVNGREADYASLSAGRNVDFKSPTVVSTVPPATTEGGQISVVGTGFGPLGEKIQIDQVSISSSKGAMTCTNMIVTVEDTTMTCDVLPGTGAAYNVNVTIAGQHSGDSGMEKFAYPPPEVTSVAPSAGRSGDQIVVTGKNFGTEDNTITIKMKGVGDESCGGVPCLSSTIVKGSPHLQALCVVPVSVGKNVPIVVDVNGQESNGTTSNSFSYDNPIIGSVTTSMSDGTAITITGQNFGPAGDCYQNYFESVQIGSALCSDSMVKKSGTEIVCLAPPGVGIDHDVVVTMRGASSGDSGKAKLSYLGPVVNSASYVPTAGGTVTISGENFGPVPDNSTGVYNGVAGPQVTITSSTGTDLPCTNITVATAHKDITCNIAKGTGGNYSIVVDVGSQSSGETGKNKLSYHPPQPLTIFPLEQKQTDLDSGNTMITVTGKNFGDDYTKLKVKVGDVFAEQTSIRMFFVQDGLVEVIARVPAGAGSEVPVRVVVDGVQSVLNSNITFSYLAPYVTSATPVGTAGGLIEIFGGNFGPNGTVPHTVTLGGVACGSPMTTENSTIQCTAAPGVGKDLDVFIQIGANSNMNSNTSGAKKFRYLCPGIESITGTAPDPSGSALAQTITVTGTNFGNTAGSIKAKIRKPEYVIEANPGSGAYFETEEVVLDTSYGTPNDFTKDYRLSFTVPPGFGNELPVVIEVAGQDSADKCAVPKELPIGDNIDYAKLFSYPRPVIDSVDAVPTAGGVLTLHGKYFGPVGSEGVNQIIVSSFDGKNITCTNPTVSVADVQATCDVGAHVGSALPVTIIVGGYASITKSLFSYSLPKVTSISPLLAKGGDTVTVTGAHFGTNSSLIGLSLMRDMSTAGSDLINFPTQVQITEPHTKFTFTAPVGTGKDRGVQVILPSGDSVANEHKSKSEVGLDEPSFSYFPPAISAMSKAPTTGGAVTITGTGFGFTASRSTMHIGGTNTSSLCSNLQVVSSDTVMTCSVEAGVGGAVPWLLNVDGQVASGSSFSYQPAQINTIMPTQGAKGAVITISGTNFGSRAEDVTILIGQYACTDTVMLVPHSKLTCRVPEGEGINVDLKANVSGVVSPASKFSFTLFGCTDDSAENYNPLATVLDSSCIFLGCTNSRSVNFNAKANKDDGSCILDPVKVVMKVKLDFQEYLKEPEFHQNVFKDDLSKNLGIPKERIMILGATAGSTVFGKDKRRVEEWMTPGTNASLPLSLSLPLYLSLRFLHPGRSRKTLNCCGRPAARKDRKERIRNQLPGCGGHHEEREPRRHHASYKNHHQGGRASGE